MGGGLVSVVVRGGVCDDGMERVLYEISRRQSLLFCSSASLSKRRPPVRAALIASPNARPTAEPKCSPSPCEASPCGPTIPKLCCTESAPNPGAPMTWAFPRRLLRTSPVNPQ